VSSGLELKGQNSPPSLDGMDAKERVEAMADWFRANYEDPAQHTPYDSGEGGYQYIWGGPYDALEEIGGAFPDAPQEDIEAAVEEVQEDGTYDWVPADGRIQPDDLDDPDDAEDRPPIEDRLAALGGQLDRIEGHVNELLALRQKDARTGSAGIGHNNPPVDDEDGPNLLEVRESIFEVRAELGKPGPVDDADEEVVVRAEGRFQRFLGWLKAQVAEVPANLVKGAVAGVGGLLAKYVWEHHVELLHLVDETTSTLSAWASWLHVVF
jgi:hypothetical protein